MAEQAGENNSGGPLPSTKDADDESLIDDVTEQELAQGITGYAIIGYRSAVRRRP